jgi:hypothetical protein
MDANRASSRQFGLDWVTNHSKHHIYPDVAGTYAVTLRVTDAAGNSSQQVSTINLGPVAPVAIVDLTQTSVLLGNTVQISAASSYDPDELPRHLQLVRRLASIRLDGPLSNLPRRMEVGRHFRITSSAAFARNPLRV